MKSTTAHPDHHKTLLYPGDRMELSTSHELRIDGDISWVSLKVTTKIQDEETAEQAYDRAYQFLCAKVDQAIDDTVEYVQKKG